MAKIDQYAQLISDHKRVAICNDDDTKRYSYDKHKEIYACIRNIEDKYKLSANSLFMPLMVINPLYNNINPCNYYDRLKKLLQTTIFPEYNKIKFIELCFTSDFTINNPEEIMHRIKATFPLVRDDSNEMAILFGTVYVSRFVYSTCLPSPYELKPIRTPSFELLEVKSASDLGEYMSWFAYENYIFEAEFHKLSSEGNECEEIIIS